MKDLLDVDRIEPIRPIAEVAAHLDLPSLGHERISSRPGDRSMPLTRSREQRQRKNTGADSNSRTSSSEKAPQEFAIAQRLQLFLGSVSPSNGCAARHRRSRRQTSPGMASLLRSDKRCNSSPAAERVSSPATGASAAVRSRENKHRQSASSPLQRHDALVARGRSSFSSVTVRFPSPDSAADRFRPFAIARDRTHAEPRSIARASDASAPALAAAASACHRTSASQRAAGGHAASPSVSRIAGG